MISIEQVTNGFTDRASDKVRFCSHFFFFPFPVPDDNALLTHMYNQAEFYWCSFTVLQPV